MIGYVLVSIGMILYIEVVWGLEHAKLFVSGANMWLQKPIFGCRSHDIAAWAMMWLKEPRLGCRIFWILFQSNNFLHFCWNLNFSKINGFLEPLYLEFFFACSQIKFFWPLAITSTVIPNFILWVVAIGDISCKGKIPRQAMRKLLKLQRTLVNTSGSIIS